MPYKVFIDDNFHYMDESERINHGEFLSADDAIAAAKRIVDDELEHLRASGVAVQDMMSMFAQFGPDPFIISDDDPIGFSARDYARDKIAQWADEPSPLNEWFKVQFSGVAVEINVEPPGRKHWKGSFEWARITRICFKSGDLLSSDEIYIFTDERPESWVIPTEADGGIELWYEILERGLFDAETAIKAAASINELFCCSTK